MNPLPYSTTKNPSAIEELFCVPFEQLPVHEMDRDLFELLAELIPAKQKFEIPESEKPQLYQLIEKRLAASFTFKINDPKLILFLAALTERPGIAVMYLTYLQYWCKVHDVMGMDLIRFCKEIFPDGFPAEDDLRQLWYKTKINRSSESFRYGKPVCPECDKAVNSLSRHLLFKHGINKWLYQHRDRHTTGSDNLVDYQSAMKSIQFKEEGVVV